MSTKRKLVAWPPALLEQLEFIAQCEHRTFSDLIREAGRRYILEFRAKNNQTFNPVQVLDEINKGKSKDD